MTDALPLRVYFRADHPGAWTADGVVICKGSQIEVAIMPIAGESHSTDQLCGDQPSVYRYYVHMLGYGDALAEPA